MDAENLGKRFRDELGIRLEPASCDYLHRRLLEVPPPVDAIPVIGGNARTGVAIRTLVKPDALAQPGR